MANNEQTVTLSAEDWIIVRASLETIVESMDPTSMFHMDTGRVYHAVARQTNGYTNERQGND